MNPTQTNRAERRRAEREPSATGSRVIELLVWGGLALLIVGGAWLAAGSDESPTAAALLSVAADDHTKGAPAPKVTLVEYLDLECEACAAYYPIVKQLKAEHGEDVQFVVRYFPLPGHKNGRLAAYAAEAASRQGKFWDMHDLLYERQREWGERPAADPSIFEEYARQLGLDMEQYAADVSSDSVRERVERDISSGMKLGVTGTPTFFLNGEKLKNPRGLEAFKRELEEAVSAE